jgi:hypothetical protein
VKKTVRESVAKILFDERSEEFIGSNRFEKVFSCFVEAGEPFCFFLGGTKKKTPVVVTTEKRRKPEPEQGCSGDICQRQDASDTIKESPKGARMLWRHLSKARCL